MIVLLWCVPSPGLLVLACTVLRAGRQVLPDLFAGRGVIWVGAGGVWLRRTGAGALRVLFGGADCQWNYVVAESASGEEMAFVHRSLQLQRTTRRVRYVILGVLFGLEPSAESHDR